MSNLDLYNAVRAVPPEAQRKISGGRLNGKTDINPVWRIKALTERFGPCGTGWRYEITDKHLEQGANGEIAAFVDINLYYRLGPSDLWSDAIPGTGGSMFVASEKSGLYTSDECYKMALTDAISVACKALGVGADVYWQADADKYSRAARTAPAVGMPRPVVIDPDAVLTKAQRDYIVSYTMVNGVQDIARVGELKRINATRGYNRTSDVLQRDFDEIANLMEELAHE